MAGDYGPYTWTVATRRVKYDGYGRIMACSKLRYGGLARLVTPASEIIDEPCYRGYGKFGSYDAFELLAIWNRGELPQLAWSGKFDKLPESIRWLKDAAVAYGEWDAPALKRILLEAGKDRPSSVDDWKRLLGTRLNDIYDEIPFPIKIVASKSWRGRYEDLPPSIPTH